MFPGNPIRAIQSEIDHFNQFSSNVKKLLLANFIYSFAIAFLNYFVNAYIYSKTDNATVVIYNFGLYTGLPIIFALNGFLLRKISIKVLYSLGMVASAGTIFYMMLLKQPTALIFFISGLFIGLCYGLHWANRNYLILDSTTNENRNYYAGSEFFLIQIAFLLTPAFSGWFISYGPTSGLYDKDLAYQIVIGIIFFFCAVAAWVLMRGTFKTPQIPAFFHFKFQAVWNRMRFYTFLKGNMQGVQIMLPSLLIMNLVGEERELGIIASLCSILSAITVYIVGRIAKPKDRVVVLAISVIIFCVSGFLHSFLYSALSVLIWQLLQTISDPLSYAAYNPIFYRAIDVAAKTEHRPEYTYVVDNEIIINAGRILGCLIFLAFIYYISDAFALRHFLAIVGLMQIATIFIVRKLPS
ncbi:MFS transporter [candidate division KSB1 bacterium]|nr:MFS transporter [candidate division KSB1 bacterium]